MEDLQVQASTVVGGVRIPMHIAGFCTITMVLCSVVTVLYSVGCQYGV
jgi:hypothetical protein